MKLYPAKDNEFIEQLSKITDANIHNEQFGVNELATQMGMSRITLFRKVKSIYNKTVNEFIRETRLKRAYEMIVNNEGTVSEIAYRVGFNSPAYFNKCFHNYYGYTPGEAKYHITENKPEKPGLVVQDIKTVKTKRWVPVAISIFIFMIVFVIAGEVFYYRPFEKGKDNNENAIAILPFVNDSGEDFAPFTAWMGIEIGNKLGKIENMLVVPQSTTEIYRDSKKSNRDIARELMVDHLLRGRIIKTGDKILLNVELVDAKTGQSNLTEIYERNLDKTEEVTLNRIFGICDDVVFQISEVLQTNLTPDEKEQVAKKPTENMTAFQVYQEANHHLDLSSGLNEHLYGRLAHKEFMKAKKLFEEAIKIDSTFASAYTMLGHIYINRLIYYANMYRADKYLDTGRIHLDKALLFDKNNFEAASYLRQYYIRKGKLNEADKLLPITENRVKNFAYFQSKLTEFHELNDRYHEAEAYFNFMETKPADMSILNYITDMVFNNYLSMGFPNRARELNEETLKSVRDTFNYFARKANWENMYGSKDSALATYYQFHKKYPTRIDHLSFGIKYYNFQGDNAKALDTLRKLEEKILLVIGLIPPNFELAGYTYLKNGMKEKADYHFKGSIKRAEDEIKLNSANARSYNSHFNLALIYAIISDKQKSLQYLAMIKESKSIPLNFINDLKTNPMFDNVRNEPEFQEISKELERKYLEEHQKIKKLLIKHGLEPA